MQRSAIILGRYGPDRNQGDFALAAFLLLILGAALRFYHLGEPSMWTDEMLEALNASKSTAYIFSLSENVEVHPPYFYFFYKLLLTAGSSDYWLRLPSAVFGTLSLFSLWRVGERHLDSRFAALAALGMLAVHPLHIWISRQVRPYALIVLCFTVALGFLLRYLESGESCHARRNLLACLPMVLSHYLGLLALGAQWAVAALAALFKGVPSVASVMWYGLGAALCAAPSAYFLWAAKFRRHEAAIEAGMGVGPAWEKVLAALKGVLAFGTDLPFAWGALGALIAAGSLTLLLRRSVASWLIALFLLPPAALVLVQYASHIYPVHLSFLLPVVVLLAGAGLDGLAPKGLRRPFVVLLLCFCLSGAFVGLKAKDYYDSKGVVATWWHMGFYKDVAATLRAAFAPGDMVAFHDLNLFESVNWYASHQGKPGVPADQELGPDAPSVMAVFVTNYESFGHVFKTEGEFKTLFGKSGAVVHLDNIRLYQAAIARTPDLSLDKARFVSELTANPTDVYARAWTLKDLGIWPYFGCALYPTKPRQPGEVVYRFTNKLEEPPRRFNLLADFDLEAPGNLLRIEYRFDDAPWSPLMEESSPSKGTCRLARFRRDAPFERLWLRAVLQAGEQTATSEYGSLGQARLSRLVLFPEEPSARFGSWTLALKDNGLGALEFFPGDILMRWGLGGKTEITYDAGDEPLRLNYKFVNRVPGQSVEVLREGERLALHENLAPGQEVSDSFELAAKPGPGRIEFRYAAWNHKDESSTFAPGDPREIAVAFQNLSLEAPDHAGPPPPPQVLPK